MKCFLSVIALVSILFIIPCNSSARTAWLSGTKWPPGCDTRNPSCECLVQIEIPDIVPTPGDVSFVNIDYSTQIVISTHVFLALPTNASVGGGITVVKIIYTDDNSCAPTD